MAGYRPSKWQGQPEGLKRANRERTRAALERQEAAKRAEGIHVPGWNEALHPRHPAGSPQGGQFAPGDRIKGTSLFSNRDKIEGEVVEVLDSGIVVKEDDGRERVVRPETAEHVGTSGLSSSAATISGVRNPQAPSRPRGPINRRRVTPESLLASTRWSPEQKSKIERVMGEFQDGTLEDGHGGRVTAKKQAVAIALSEARSLTAGGRFDERKHRRKRKGERGGGRFTAKDAVEAAKGIALWMSPTTDAERAMIERARFDRPALRPGQGFLAAGSWDESKHPRHDEGSPQGGQFSAKDAIDKADSGDDPLPGDDEPYTPTDDERDAYDEGYGMGESMAEDASDEEILDLVKGMDPEAKKGPVMDGFLDGLGDRAAEIPWGDELPDSEDAEPEGYEGEPLDFYDDSVDSAADDLISNLEGEEPTEADFEDHAREYMDDLAEEDPEFDPQSFIQAVATRYFEKKKGETASALTASAAGLAPLTPPKSWFDKPQLEGPTAITVTADGQVYGHAALWGTCHTGMPGVCRTPPRSQSGYRFFHLGEVDTDDGAVAVGRVTMDTGHAPLTASKDGAVRHYDDTGTGIAHVRAYEDDHGIVLAGALAPGVPAEKAKRFRGATVSGDWRSIQGKLEMVGMLAVNVPGFPVPRAMAASLMVEDEPHTMALVAAGVYRDDDEDKRKLKALTARAMGGVDGLAAAAGYKSKSRRRMGVTAAGRPFDESKHPRAPRGSEHGGRWVRVTFPETGQTEYREGLPSQVVKELREENPGTPVATGAPDAIKVAPIDKPPEEDARLRSGESGFVQDTVEISKHGKTYRGTIEKVTPGAAMVRYTTDNGKTKTIRVPHREYKVVN